MVETPARRKIIISKQSSFSPDKLCVQTFRLISGYLHNGVRTWAGWIARPYPNPLSS